MNVESLTLQQKTELATKLVYSILHDNSLEEELMDKHEDLFLSMDEALGEIRVVAMNEEDCERIVENERAGLRSYMMQGQI